MTGNTTAGTAEPTKLQGVTDPCVRLLILAEARGHAGERYFVPGAGMWVDALGDVAGPVRDPSDESERAALRALDLVKWRGLR